MGVRSGNLILYNFSRQKVPLKNIMLSHHCWGEWNDHIHYCINNLPQKRLMLRYENLKRNIDPFISLPGWLLKDHNQA